MPSLVMIFMSLLIEVLHLHLHCGIVGMGFGL